MARKSNRKNTDKTPDIRAVAALAKVSIATVSRTINGSPVVSEKLSKRVWQAIEQLNYFPNTHARTLVSGRSRLFGIIVENITNPFFPELIQSFEEIAVANGYEILVSSSNSDPAVLTTCVRRMLERKVEGVAVMTFGEEEPVLDQLSFHDIPVVLAEFKLDRTQGQHHPPRLQHWHSCGRPHLAALGHTQDRLPRRPPQAALRHHTRRTTSRAAMQEEQTVHREEVDHRVRSHAQGRRRSDSASFRSRSQQPRQSSAPTT